MQSNYSISLEIGTLPAMELDLYTQETGVATLQDNTAHAPNRGLCASVMAEDDKLDGSLKSKPSDQGPPPAIPDGNSTSASHSIAILQPALARSVSAQSNQALVFNDNRSMSDLVNNPIDNGTLEYGPAGEYHDHMRSSAMKHYRTGRYRAALECFMSRQKMYISIVTFVVMFGMTAAGLWLEIAGSHQALV